MKDTAPTIEEMREVIHTFEMLSLKNYRHRVYLMTKEK